MTRGRLHSEQVEQLLKPINPRRVLVAQRQSHIPAYDVAAHLTRIFGFGGWDKEILSLTLIDEHDTVTNANKPAVSVTYSCTMRLTIYNLGGEKVASWEDGACGTSILLTKGDAHDMAMKSAISYALKRCAAFGLGDQFGLSLYNKGMTDALIGATVGGSAGDVQSSSPTPESMGNDERQDEVTIHESDSGDFSEPLADLTEGFRALQFTRAQVFEFVKGNLPTSALAGWGGDLSTLSDIDLNVLLKALEAWVAGSEGEDALNYNDVADGKKWGD